MSTVCHCRPAPGPLAMSCTVGSWAHSFATWWALSFGFGRRAVFQPLFQRSSSVGRVDRVDRRAMVYRERDEEAPGSALWPSSLCALRCRGPPRKLAGRGLRASAPGRWRLRRGLARCPAPGAGYPSATYRDPETKHAETFPSGTKGPDEHEEFSAAVAETVNDKGPLPEKPRVSDLPPQFRSPDLQVKTRHRYCVISMELADESACPYFSKLSLREPPKKTPSRAAPRCQGREGDRRQRGADGVGHFSGGPSAKGR